MATKISADEGSMLHISIKLITSTLLVACAGHPASVESPPPCMLNAAVTRLPDHFTIVGRYQLTLVATAGPRTGSYTTGNLVIDTLPDSVRTYRENRYSKTELLLWFTRFNGTTDIDLAPVGAGGSRSGADPNPYEPPVVAPWQSHPPAWFIIIGEPLYGTKHGSRTQLKTYSGTATWIQGNWEYEPTKAAGYFCAVRIP